MRARLSVLDLVQGRPTGGANRLAFVAMGWLAGYIAFPAPAEAWDATWDATWDAALDQALEQFLADVLN